MTDYYAPASWDVADGYVVVDMSKGNNYVCRSGGSQTSASAR